MLLLVLIGITPALVIQAYNEYDLRQSRENEIREKTIQITKQFGAEMGELREGAHQLLVALSRLPSVRVMDSDSCPKALSALDESFPNYNFLGVADTAGQIRCSSRSNFVSSVADLDFFKRAMVHDGLAVGNYWVNPTTGEKQVNFGLRFSNEVGGSPAGVVFVSLDLNWLAEHLKERGLASTQSILIADREGTILARLPNGGNLVGKNMRKGHAEIMDGNTSGWEEAKGVDGVERIFGYVPPALPPGDFFLSAGESKAAAFATISGITHRGIALILLGLVIAAFAAWAGGRRFIQRPIANLLQVSSQWRTGNYSSRVELNDRRSEIGQLGLAFNEMADAVQARHAAQQEAEEQLRQVNATLEQRVDERTQELVAANLAKSQFLANMSHEIRTPMNGVLGMIELLLQTELAPTQRRYVDTVRRSADTLLGLINGILDLSKIEAGKLELECHDFNLRELMEDITYSFSEAAGRKGLELMCFVSSNVPTALVGDPGRLRQIFTNLISNAMKFTEAGEIVLDASLSEATASSALIQFEVRDTGVGISPQNQARIFGAFSQADGSMSRRYGGTGLGLSIAKDLCEMMGGSIEVTSKEGVGSTFRFSARFGQQATSVRHSRAARYGNRLRVLVVDDNPTNREILQDQLANAGFRVAAAHSGGEALSMARHAARCGYPFGAALVDMLMPDMNGLELAQAIKSDPVLEPLQIVLLTSLGQEMSETSRHVVTQLTKPVRGRELLDCLYALENNDVPAPAASEPVWPVTSLAAGRRVLLVEDSPVNTEVAVGILESFGCVIETAVHGREALTIYAEREFDVIFMDCQMPEMDGFETTAEIRKREAAGGRRTPIVALTANAIKGDRERCLEADMDDYLAKPFTRSEMEVVLKALFAGPDVYDTVAAGDSLFAAVPETSPADVLDERVFAALRQLQRVNRPDIVKRTIGLYFENAPRLLQELREGAIKRDAAVLGRASHTLKSNSANVGAIRLAARCSELEALARSGDVAKACSLVRGVIEDYIIVDAVLSEHLGKAA
jgi:signal transduction histidine kinase/DNA-binding response OmpR family regulator/HPt (histidine-containing phosphotransfer) domain-containing protein